MATLSDSSRIGAHTSKKFVFGFVVNRQAKNLEASKSKYSSIPTTIAPTAATFVSHATPS